MVRNALKPMLRRMREQARKAALFESRLEQLNPDAAIIAAESKMTTVEHPQGDSVFQSIAKAWAKCCNVETVAKTLGLSVDTVQLATVDARAQRAMQRVKEQRASLAFR